MKRGLLISVLSFFMWIQLIGQIDKSPSCNLFISSERLIQLDDYAIHTPAKAEKDCATLTEYLLKEARNDAEKVRLVFTWIASHIDYDAEGYNTNSFGDLSAKGVLKDRKGICEGFTNLFFALCDVAVLEVKKISGYAKGYGYSPKQKFNETNHAWNAVKIDGNWYLMDATWGQGYGETKKGKLVSRIEFNDYWFATHPKEFIFTHFPEDHKWQLLSEPVSKAQFEQMPYLNPLLFYLGFNKDSIFSRVMNGKKPRFVKVYDVERSVKILSAPFDYDIKKGEVFNCSIKSTEIIEVVAIVNNRWIPFAKESDSFTINFKPDPGDLSIAMKFGKKEKNYQTFLKYRILRFK